ncbi:MAG: stage III sporulation protein AE [Firmicutes bacterium]|nr:stage III sporulation protein AE [Bacillota bacterium]
MSRALCVRLVVALGLGLGAVVLAGPALSHARAADTARSSGTGAPAYLEDEIEAQAEMVGLEEVQRLLDELNREMEAELPPLDLRSFVAALLRGEAPYSFTGLVKAVGLRLIREVVANSWLLGRLVILAVLCGLLQAMQSAFAHHETSDLAFGVCYLVLVVLATGGFLAALGVCRGVIDRLTDFMHAVLPVLVTLLAGLGAVTTAGLFSPVLVGAMEIVAWVIRDIVLPVVVAAAAVDLVSRTFTRIRLTALADLLRLAAVVVTGTLLVLFVGLVGAYGAVGAVADGVALKAAKFAAGNLIPFIGKVLADAADVVLGSSLVLKNAVGVVGVLAVLTYTVFPLLKVAAMVLVYRLAAALVQPLGVGELSGGLASVATSLSLMTVVACGVGVLFVFTLAVLAGAATAVTGFR